MNVEGDRLSNLPDDLIHKIFSFIETKHVIQTSVLSSRYRYIWTSMPYLNVSSFKFVTKPQFSKFVTHVLSGRNNQIEVSSVKLNFCGPITRDQEFVKRILNKILSYAFAHNIQLLDITCTQPRTVTKSDFTVFGSAYFQHHTLAESPSFTLFGSQYFKHHTLAESPITLFSSQSLKHLTLDGFYQKEFITTPSTWELPALTSLNLRNVTLYDDNTDESAGLFSNCANLKNLKLSFCKMGSGRFKICHPRLSNLTLENGREDCKLVTPQLKNLTIRRYWRGIHVHLISAPNLACLRYEGCFDSLQVSADLLHLQKVDICIFPHSGGKANAHVIVCLLRKLHSVKFLTLDSEIIKILCSDVELISHQPSPFANLKSLKIYPNMYIFYVTDQQKVTMCTEVKNYLLDGSPGATFTMLSHEDIRAMEKTKLAQKNISKLRALLEQEKASIETKTVKMHEQEKTQIDIDSCWRYLSVQIEDGEKKFSHIISKLKEIKELMGELPASNRATIQPSFSSLCAEADVVMNKITDWTKMQCDENLRRVSVCFHELATTLQTSS